ncbi:MAG: response regulator [Anaerolineae bacterium]|nr:response regulator [Anaerolineae bacterium]
MSDQPVPTTARVLIIEDDLDLVETYVDILESDGHDVHTINSSAQALDYLIKNRNRPDVVILDMSLPGESGIVVLGLIRRLPKLARTKVIIASGYPDLAKHAIDNWGADLFLQKPISMDELKNAVKTFGPS